ncbi:hypothetical protein ECDEC14D_3461 [Escherichia coli DEC14D]|nr:hypothetical protein ECDEC14D_3461 [Escherichia coli DEC14D]
MIPHFKMIFIDLLFPAPYVGAKQDYIFETYMLIFFYD